MYSGIFELYHQGRDFEKAVFIDVLDDIIFSYSRIKSGFSKIEDGLNGLRKIYKIQGENIKNINQDIKGVLTYKKVNSFSEALLKQMILRDENEIIQIRILRIKFIKELLASKLISESKEINDNNALPDELFDIKKGLKYFTKLNNKGELSITFNKIKEEPGLIIIGKKKFYIQDPKNIGIFLGIAVIKGIVEFYGTAGFNKLLRTWNEKNLEENEDLDLIFINFQINEIEKIKNGLLESDSKELITGYNINGGCLYINGNQFRLSPKAPKASNILSFLCNYLETYRSKTRVNSTDLQKFLNENKKTYPSLTEKDLEIEKIRTGFFRTFEGALLKKYKFNNILGREKEHLVLIGKE